MAVGSRLNKQGMPVSSAQFVGVIKVMDRKEILAKLASGELTAEEADKLLEDQDKRKQNSLYCKVGNKGGISVYGFGSRFPVTLYVDQWEKLLDFGDGIRSFAKEHDSELKRKK
ncbi:unnamed protein product [marine sediment metagenome]|uniref:Uncharacterized protein n=1 Tax=marine sediment metagenome TaxID=412755 RepID=X1A7L7_9ZZZZ